MLETEAKFRVESLEPVRRRLKDLGAVFLEACEETDIYYNYEAEVCGDLALSDEALRLRISKGRVELTYKGPRLEGPYKSRVELTVTVSDPAMMSEILRHMGLAEAAVVRKRREKYRLGDTVVSLDSVEGLGTFVEIEYAGGRGDASKTISRVAGLLGLTNPTSKSYLELIVEGAAGEMHA